MMFETSVIIAFSVFFSFSNTYVHHWLVSAMFSCDTNKRKHLYCDKYDDMICCGTVSLKAVDFASLLCHTWIYKFSTKITGKYQKRTQQRKWNQLSRCYYVTGEPCEEMTDWLCRVVMSRSWHRDGSWTRWVVVPSSSLTLMHQCHWPLCSCHTATRVLSLSQRSVSLVLLCDYH